MDNRYLEKVIAEMMPFIEREGFSENNDGSFSNEKKSFKVEYDTEKQMYVLSIADLDEEKAVGEYVKASEWLFDDSQTEKDAESVGIDFVETLQKNMGIKNRLKVSSEVELPTSDGDKYTMSTFTKKVLDTYPLLKDTYKISVSQYGNFLYLNFFGKNLVPLLVQTVNESNKKSDKKILDLFEPAFVKGDNEVSNTAVALLGAVYLKDAATAARLEEILGENTSLKSSVVSFAGVLKSKKKLKAVFGL